MSLKDWAIEILEGIILINDWHGKAQLIEGGSIPGWWFWVSKEIRLSEPGRPCQDAALFHGLLLSSCLYVPVLTNLSDARDVEVQAKWTLPPQVVFGYGFISAVEL